MTSRYWYIVAIMSIIPVAVLLLIFWRTVITDPERPMQIQVVIDEWPTPVPTHTPLPTVPPTPEADRCHSGAPTLGDQCRRFAFLQGSGAAQAFVTPVEGDFSIYDAWNLDHHDVELPHCKVWDSAAGGGAEPLGRYDWLTYAVPIDHSGPTLFRVGGFDQARTLIQLPDPAVPANPLVLAIGGNDYHVWRSADRVSCRLVGGATATIAP